MADRAFYHLQMSTGVLHLYTYVHVKLYSVNFHHNTQVTFPVALEVVSGRQSILSSTNEHMSVAFIYIPTCIVILCKLPS